MPSFVAHQYPESEATEMPGRKVKAMRTVRQPNDLYTIETFCDANAMSESTYYALKRDGLGPREIKIGKKILISPEAEAEWRREREDNPIERTGPGRPSRF